MGSTLPLSLDPSQAVGTPLLLPCCRKRYELGSIEVLSACISVMRYQPSSMALICRGLGPQVSKSRLPTKKTAEAPSRHREGGMQRSPALEMRNFSTSSTCICRSKRRRLRKGNRRNETRNLRQWSVVSLINLTWRVDTAAASRMKYFVWNPSSSLDFSPGRGTRSSMPPATEAPPSSWIPDAVILPFTGSVVPHQLIRSWPEQEWAGALGVTCGRSDENSPLRVGLMLQPG